MIKNSLSLVFLVILFFNLHCFVLAQDHIQRFNLSVGMISPQQSFILQEHIDANYSSDYYVQASSIPISLSYERRNPDNMYGIGISFASGQPEVINDDPTNDFHALFKHYYLGGSFYWYPDEYIEFEKLTFFSKATFGALYVDKLVSNYNNSAAPDYWFEDNILVPFLSIYAGARYQLLEKFEVQAEIGYRETSLMKVGINIKL